MSSIKDVAKLAGVSISTASNALNRTRYVRAETIEKVEYAAKVLNYSVDPIARSMKSNKTAQIGVITEDICGVFYPYVVRGINSVAIEKGYNILISDTQGTYGNEDAVNREKAIFERLINARVDGIIFVSAVSEKNMAEYFEEILRKANRHKHTPLVSLERDLTSVGIPSVYYDSYSNAVLAVQHLVHRGCRHIGHITGPVSMQIACERIQGYKDCLAENHQELDEARMISVGDYSHQSGYAAMMELLEKFPEIDGVFCGNDQMAIGALKALKEKSKRVPEDIKLIGYDDSFVSTIVEPAISTIHVPKRRAGIEAAKLLFSLIEMEDSWKLPPAGHKMDGTLVVRNSTVPDAKADWILSEW